MIRFIFTEKCNADFNGLPSNVQARVTSKLTQLKSHPDIMSVLKRLQYIMPPTYSLRIGNYRMLLNIKGAIKSGPVFWVTKIAHRRNVYN